MLRILSHSSGFFYLYSRSRPSGFSSYSTWGNPKTVLLHHIIPIKHGGDTAADNLALSCLSCNRHKGSDFVTIDQVTKEIVPLFNPRLQVWDEHFCIENARIEGKTQIGQVTSRLLQFNIPNRVLERQVLISQSQYPDPKFSSM
ncbi:HNH endonuclease [Calothrix sp. PCC 6303]|uniref:HNH endonuclease n=1 Tax=Calothrix sp. PCC 6303 TaxID=1170562 RepID=UPI0002A03214|nr:HNH endonuclease signature motif containing protein [Calothrix sp. PCC 6303]AFZ01545.1 HNH endonuclease [Calothrix sp. PCC 6303]